MKDFVLMTDSCCDLPAELAEEMELAVLPLSVMQDGRTYQNYLDHRELDPKDFYARVRNGSTGSTAAANAEAFMEAMTVPLEAGKDILCVCFSSALSTTYQSAVIAQQELSGTYPDRKIQVIDSLCASLGQGMLLYLAHRERQKGRTMEETASFVRETIPHLCHYFTVDDLNHLKRGGRVSATAAVLGTMLQMKPILHMDDQGRLIPLSKVRGRRASIQALLAQMDELVTDAETVFISHGDCAEEVEAMAQQIRDRFGTKEVIINYVGPVIGNHTGAGVVALFFIGKHR